MIRPLTPGERALAEEAFGDALDLRVVRLAASPLRRAFVPGHWFGRSWIVWPRRTLVADISEAPLRLQGLLVHELTHVWQAQTGRFLPWAKLKAGDGPAAYAYPLDETCRWGDLNIEQQAQAVEHRFLHSRGVRTPAAAAFYDRLCPFSRRMEI
jgi:hypothetical protein